ncbi:TPA: dephospho-CoA kinase [bacterium]|nr:dephospho-CoA kinase [bacterium]
MVVGLTGGYGTGKSTAAKFFKQLGARLIDADSISRKILSKGEETWQEVIHFFGQKILDSNGSIDRAKLADLIFKDEALRRRLNEVAHPRIRLEIEEEIKKFRNLKSEIQPPKILIIDAPLLLEAGMQDLVDCLIVVNLHYEEQIKRVMERDNLNQKEAIKRISAQLPISAKLEVANYVIDNKGTFEETREQVEKIWKTIVEEG